jgi:hypothetical protein
MGSARLVYSYHAGCLSCPILPRTTAGHSPLNTGRTTALHDTASVQEKIPANTGHTIARIIEVLDRDTKLTA